MNTSQQEDEKRRQMIYTYSQPHLLNNSQNGVVSPQIHMIKPYSPPLSVIKGQEIQHLQPPASSHLRAKLVSKKSHGIPKQSQVNSENDPNLTPFLLVKHQIESSQHDERNLREMVYTFTQPHLLNAQNQSVSQQIQMLKPYSPPVSLNNASKPPDMQNQSSSSQRNKLIGSSNSKRAISSSQVSSSRQPVAIQGNQQALNQLHLVKHQRTHESHTKQHHFVDLMKKENPIPHRQVLSNEQNYDPCNISGLSPITNYNHIENSITSPAVRGISSANPTRVTSNYSLAPSSSPSNIQYICVNSLSSGGTTVNQSNTIKSLNSLHGQTMFTTVMSNNSMSNHGGNNLLNGINTVNYNSINLNVLNSLNMGSVEQCLSNSMNASSNLNQGSTFPLQGGGVSQTKDVILCQESSKNPQLSSKEKNRPIYAKIDSSNLMFGTSTDISSNVANTVISNNASLNPQHLSEGSLNPTNIVNLHSSPISAHNHESYHNNISDNSMLSRCASSPESSLPDLSSSISLPINLIENGSDSLIFESSPFKDVLSAISNGHFSKDECLKSDKDVASNSNSIASSNRLLCKLIQNYKNDPIPPLPLKPVELDKMANISLKPSLPINSSTREVLNKSNVSEKCNLAPHTSQGNSSHGMVFRPVSTTSTSSSNSSTSVGTSSYMGINNSNMMNQGYRANSNSEILFPSPNNLHILNSPPSFNDQYINVCQNQQLPATESAINCSTIHCKDMKSSPQSSVINQRGKGLYHQQQNSSIKHQSSCQSQAVNRAAEQEHQHILCSDPLITSASSPRRGVDIDTSIGLTDHQIMSQIAQLTDIPSPSKINRPIRPDDIFLTGLPSSDDSDLGLGVSLRNSMANDLVSTLPTNPSTAVSEPSPLGSSIVDDQSHLPDMPQSPVLDNISSDFLACNSGHSKSSIAPPMNSFLQTLSATSDLAMYLSSHFLDNSNMSIGSLSEGDASLIAASHSFSESLDASINRKTSSSLGLSEELNFTNALKGVTGKSQIDSVKYKSPDPYHNSPKHSSIASSPSDACKFPMPSPPSFNSVIAKARSSPHAISHASPQPKSDSPSPVKFSSDSPSTELVIDEIMEVDEDEIFNNPVDDSLIQKVSCLKCKLCSYLCLELKEMTIHMMSKHGRGTMKQMHPPPSSRPLKKANKEPPCDEKGKLDSGGTCMNSFKRVKLSRDEDKMESFEQTASNKLVHSMAESDNARMAESDGDEAKKQESPPPVIISDTNTSSLDSLLSKEVLQSTSPESSISPDCLLNKDTSSDIRSLSPCGIPKLEKLMSDDVYSIKSESASPIVKSEPLDVEPTTSTKSPPNGNRPGRPPLSKSIGIAKFRKDNPKLAVPESMLGFRCGLSGCGLRLKLKENMEYHRLCHKEAQLECPECQTMFAHWSNLAIHLWKVHYKDMELHKCEHCNYKTYSLTRLINTHAMSHTDERPHSCEVCLKDFKTVKQLKSHMIHHSDERDLLRHHCDMCQRKFAEKRMLLSHLEAVHKKAKPYLCSYCGNTFASKSTLNLHIRKHTGEKPFSCDLCDYATADHNSMRRHKMKHSNAKRYSCPYCSYTSIQSSTFKVHLRKKHESQAQKDGIIFSCAICSFKTVKRDNFLSHMGTQHQMSEQEQNSIADEQQLHMISQLNPSSTAKPIPGTSQQSAAVAPKKESSPCTDFILPTSSYVPVSSVPKYTAVSTSNKFIAVSTSGEIKPLHIQASVSQSFKTIESLGDSVQLCSSSSSSSLASSKASSFIRSFAQPSKNIREGETYYVVGELVPVPVQRRIDESERESTQTSQPQEMMMNGVVLQGNLSMVRKADQSSYPSNNAILQQMNLSNSGMVQLTPEVVAVPISSSQTASSGSQTVNPEPNSSNHQMIPGIIYVSSIDPQTGTRILQRANQQS